MVKLISCRSRTKSSSLSCRAHVHTPPPPSSEYFTTFNFCGETELPRPDILWTALESFCINAIFGASGSEPHTSGKARLPVVEYYEFGPRSESGIPSIRLPS